jgi:hypothetical protein
LIEARLEGPNTVYQLTDHGEASLSKALEYFERVFGVWNGADSI